MQKQTLKILSGFLLSICFIVMSKPVLAAYEISDSSVKLLLHMNGDVVDSSGNANNGTAYNMTYGTGKLATSTVYNGSSAYISLSDQASMQLTSLFTLAFWYYPQNVTTNGNQRLFNQWLGTGNQYGFNFYQPANSGNLDYTDTSNCQIGTIKDKATTGGPLTANAWNYVVVRRNGTYVDFWVNGSHVADNGNAINSATCNSTDIYEIGDDNGAEFMANNNNLDEFVYANAFWSTSTITDLYNGGAGNAICTTAGCAAGTTSTSSLSTSTDCFLGTDTTDWELLKNIVLWTFYFLFTVVIVSLFWKWISKFKKFTK